MNNEEYSLSENKTPQKPSSWDWIWPSISGLIIVKLFGVAGGLVTIFSYLWLKPKVGTWGALGASAVLGVVTSIGLLAMIKP